MKTFLIKSFLFTIIFCGGISATYFLIKARSESKTTTDVEATKLYVTNGETLNSAKRNSLVDKTIGVGTLETKTINTVYQAATDGFIEITSSGASCAGTVIRVYVDNINSPVNRVSALRDCNSVMAVVKKGQYRKADKTAGSGTYSVRRVPLGN